MKSVCSSLREHAIKAKSFERKKMLSLTEKELKLHQDSTTCYICGKIFLKSLLKIEIRDHCHLTCKYRDGSRWVKL